MKTDNPFCGKSVAVTGKLDNYTRDGIKARLLELGARPVSKVSRRTDYLILGKRPGDKLVKALSLGIAVLSEQEFEDMVSQSKGSKAGDRSAAPLCMQQEATHTQAEGSEFG